MWVLFLLVPALVVGTQNTTVHLIVHSHDDLGWLLTEDSYYYGCYRYKTHGVDTIISNIVSSLLLNPNRRSVYAEVGFLKMWWEEQSEEAHKIVRDLVHSGRLEIVNGGWAMPDEACPHYNDLLNNFIVGHEFLTKELGILPRTAYQIDPFGHSAEFANLVIQLGYTNLVINRIHHKDRDQRRAMKEMEFFWSPYNNTSKIFTHILYNHYSTPSQMQFDDDAWDDMVQPFVDRVDSPCFSANQFQNIFMQHVGTWGSGYKTSHVIMPIGNDFTLALGHRTFNNLDRLIKHFNNNPKLGLKVKYSTISEYFAEVRRENKNWSTKTGDFFPYADGEHAYWAGFYTTRPWLKENIVKTGRYQRSLDKMLALRHANTVLGGNSRQIEFAIEKMGKLREYLGLLMHHDAVSGTSVQNVATTYNRRLILSKAELDGLVSELVTHNPEINFFTCDALFNETSCEYLEKAFHSNNSFEVAIFNPSSSPQEKIIELPINYKNITVTDNTNAAIKFNIILNDNFITSTNFKYKVIFRAILPALSTKYFTISTQSKEKSEISYIEESTGELHNERYTLRYINNQFTLNDYSTNMNFSFLISPEYYTPFYSNKGNNQKSGHYIFRPETDITTIISPCKSYKLLTTDFFSRLKFKCGDLVSVSVSLYKLSENLYPEVEYYIDGNQVSRKQMEIIARYNTDVYHGDKFYTDSNSLGYMKRKWNNYDGVDIDIKEEVAFNYYPVTGYLAVKSNSTGMWLGIVPDRSQGGTALSEKSPASKHGTELELMIYRQTNSVDGKGITEPYLETIDGSKSVSIITKHVIVPEDSLDKVRVASFKREDQPQIFFSYASKASLLRPGSTAIHVDITSCGDLSNYIVHLRLKTPEIFILRVQQLVNSGSFPIGCYISSILPPKKNYTIVELNLDENETYHRMTSRSKAWEYLIESSDSISLIPGDPSLGISWEVEYSNDHVTFEDFPIRTFAFKIK